MDLQEITVLLVEDDDVAAEGVMRCLRRSEVPYKVVWAVNGREALVHLRGGEGVPPIENPLVLLDLNMPVMNGFEFLQEVRSDPNLRKTIVFVLTTSSTEQDRTRAYNEVIAGYMVKSMMGRSYRNLRRLLDDYRATVIMP